MPQSNEYMLKQDDAELIYQKKLTAGTNITIDPITNTISSTGGGGSSVSYSGSLPQGYGDTIGIITIDGTQYPIKTRNLIQGSNINIVQDQETGNLTISSTAQGTRVEPNPSGTPTDTLDTIGINDTIYEIEGGGSGNVADVYVNGTSVLDENDIAQVFSHEEVTEQEYEALPSTKESDNIMYCIKGSRPSTNGNYFTPIIYSTEEKEIGVWINGKPLYQKTFDCGALLNAQTKEVSFTEDMETATIIDAFAMSTSEGYVISLPDVVPNYVAGSVRIYVSKTAKKIYIYSQADMRTYDKSYVTIQYTKTTDVAGSGQYTTLGIPAVHYDGNERVIGTWFGETLYEKIINFDYNNIQSRTSSGCEIYINVPNIKDTKDSVILFEGGIIQFPYFVNMSTFIGGFTQTETDTFHISLRYSSSVYSELNAYLTDCRVKLQYTKTTD